jgi:hypothetical protein
MALPEEIFQWIASYDYLPKQYSVGFLGSTRDGRRRQIIEAIAKYYPDALLQTSIVPNGSDPSPRGRFGRDDYYRNLQKCRIVLSLAGAGYDTFRFWENAACNAVHFCARMPLFIPNDFKETSQIFRFTDIDEIRRSIDSVLDRNTESHEIIRNARNHLVKFHLTTSRAEYFLDKVKLAFAC